MNHISDPSSMMGIGTLLNLDDGDGVLDLAALEKEVTGNAPKQNASELFESELKHLNTDFDIPKKNINEIKYPSSVINDTFKYNNHNDINTKSNPSGEINNNNNNNSFFKGLSDNDSSSDEEPRRRKPSKKAIIMSDDDDIYNNQTYNNNNNTDEQKKSFVIRRALSEMKMSGDFDLQKEAEEEEKDILLTEIDTLLDILKEENVSVENVKIPDRNASLHDISKTHRILQLKNDTNRSRVLAEESLLTITGLMEQVFDGQRVIFGRKPNLTGWSNTVGAKMRRMRFDTSSFVNNIMRHNNFGPGTRLMIELVPSMFIYSKMKKHEQGRNLYSSEEMGAAYSAIRDVDENNT